VTTKQRRRQTDTKAERIKRRDEYLAIREQIGTQRIIEILDIAPQTAKIYATKSTERVITRRDLKRLKAAIGWQS